jgi:glutamate racemase
MVVETYLHPLREQGIDTLMLGCTHFPFVRDLIQDVLGRGREIVDPNGDLIRELKAALTGMNGLRKGIARRRDHRFIVSRFPDTFQQVGSALLGWPIAEVEEVLVGKPPEGFEIPEKDLYNPDKISHVKGLLNA